MGVREGAETLAFEVRRVTFARLPRVVVYEPRLLGQVKVWGECVETRISQGRARIAGTGTRTRTRLPFCSAARIV
jgi:hypothetical protein